MVLHSLLFHESVCLKIPAKIRYRPSQKRLKILFFVILRVPCFFLPFPSLENLSYLHDLSCASFIKQCFWLYNNLVISFGIIISYMPYRLFLTAYLVLVHLIKNRRSSVSMCFWLIILSFSPSLPQFSPCWGGIVDPQIFLQWKKQNNLGYSQGGVCIV